MKKLFIISSFVLLFGLGISGAHAADTGFVALAPIPNLTEGATATAGGLALFFNNLYKYLVGLAAALAVIQIIWAGIEIAANRDNVGTLLDEKGKIYNAIFGLILVLSPVLVFSIINPSILNLSLSLDPLHTAPVSSFSGSTSSVPAVDSTSGCTVSGTLLKTASCPTNTAAQQFVTSCSATGGSGSISACQTEIPGGGCADKTYSAICTSPSAGPFVFLDTSYYLNPVQLFSNYIPLVASASDLNNGSKSVQFANTCTQDGGVTCVSTYSILSTTCPTIATPQPTSQTNKCKSLMLSCGPSSLLKTLNVGGSGVTGVYVCSGSPSWTPIK